MKNKWILGSLLSLAVTAGIFTGTAISSQAAEGDVEINEKNFPDEYFRSEIKNFDEDLDGILSTDELEAVTRIDVSGYYDDITDLTGIEYFYNLEVLQCDGTGITKLDVTKCKNLKSLECPYSELESLNISGNTKLESLSCNGTKLKKLDTSSCTNLEWLDCSYSELESLNVSGNTKLKSLSCFDTKLKKLDTSSCTNLKSLECYGSELESLNVSENTKLESLLCYDTKLKKLDTSNCTNLKLLDCSYSKLESLNISGNTKLESLLCYDTKLKKLDTSKCKSLTYLDYSNNKLGAIDFSKNTKLETLICANTELKELDITKHKNLTYLDCSNNKLGSIDFSKNTKLERLVCVNTNLKKLDLSKHKNLKYLDCSDNKLSSIDVSKNTELTTLICNNTNLTKLDITKCKKLSKLSCTDNELSSLNLSNNNSLGIIDVSKNNLKTLNLPKDRSGISRVACSKNKLACLNIGNYDLRGEETATSKCYPGFECEDNVRYVSVNSKNQFDLSSISGFDVKQMSNLKGGKLSGTILTFTSNTVTYTYDTGAFDFLSWEKATANFTLKKCSHKKDAVKKTTKASFSKDGSVKTVCPDCGKTIKKVSTIYKMETPKLSKTSYTYTGKAKKPTVTVKNSKGTELKEGTHYTVTYASGRKNVGTYKVDIKGKGNYTGSVTKTFKINPAATEITKLSAVVKGFTVKWSKVTTQTTGYQIKYSLKKDFSDATTVTVKDNTVTSKKITGLKAGKKYYVKVRTYKKVSDKTYYSSWSEVKAKTTGK